MCIWTPAGLERGWLHLNKFDPANLAHILKHNSPFLANTATDSSSLENCNVPGIFSHIFATTTKEEPGEVLVRSCGMSRRSDKLHQRNDIPQLRTSTSPGSSFVV